MEPSMESAWIFERLSHQTFQVPKMEVSSPIYDVLRFGLCKGSFPPPPNSRK